MKLGKLINALCLVLICALMMQPVCIAADAQTKINEYCGEIDSWIDAEGNISYPVTNLSTEWKNMTIAERRAACQIPEQLLEEVTTPELLDIVIKYPDIFVIFEEDYEEGFQNFRMSFNGLEELMKRDDLVDVLIKTYTDSLVIEEPRHYFQPLL